MEIPTKAVFIIEGIAKTELIRIAQKISDMGGKAIVEENVDIGHRLGVVLHNRPDVYRYIPEGYWLCHDKTGFFTMTVIEKEFFELFSIEFAAF